MREWLSNLPWLGKWFWQEVPEARRLENPSNNPQLIAEKRHSEQLQEAGRLP